MAAIRQRYFGRTSDGRAVESFELVNDRGLEAKILTYGGILAALRTPDRDGRLADVVLGFDDLQPYFQNRPYFGCIVGRYANRIAGARFTIGGRSYQLAANDGRNHLHGGTIGFDKRLWNADPRLTTEGAQLALAYRSPAGEEGYPGNLDITVVYTLSAQDELRIDYSATSDAETIVNLTNHSYFNLAGAGTILDHSLRLAAQRYLPVNDELIPLGERCEVRGTAFDFNTPRSIGSGFSAGDKQLRLAGGYDHCFVLATTGQPHTPAVELYDPSSGRVLELFTTQPGIQLYTGNCLDGTVRGKGGRAYPRHSGLCLESEHFPDAPNRPAFPSTVLKRGDVYHHTTRFKFAVKTEG